MLEDNYYLKTYEKHYAIEKGLSSIRQIEKILTNFCHLQDLLNQNINDLAITLGNTIQSSAKINPSKKIADLQRKSSGIKKESFDFENEIFLSNKDSKNFMQNKKRNFLENFKPDFALNKNSNSEKKHMDTNTPYIKKHFQKYLEKKEILFKEKKHKEQVILQRGDKKIEEAFNFNQVQHKQMGMEIEKNVEKIDECILDDFNESSEELKFFKKT